MSHGLFVAVALLFTFRLRAATCRYVMPEYSLGVLFCFICAGYRTKKRRSNFATVGQLPRYFTKPFEGGYKIISRDSKAIKVKLYGGALQFLGRNEGVMRQKVGTGSMEIENWSCDVAMWTVN